MGMTRDIRAAFAGVLALLCLGIAPMAAAASEQSAHAAKANSNQLYIVRLTENPVVAYEGGIAGYAATKPGRGSKIDPNSSQVTRYVGYLDSRHNDVVARVGGRKVYDYPYSF